MNETEVTGAHLAHPVGPGEECVVTRGQPTVHEVAVGDGHALNANASLLPKSHLVAMRVPDYDPGTAYRGAKRHLVRDRAVAWHLEDRRVGRSLRRAVEVEQASRGCGCEEFPRNVACQIVGTAAHHPKRGEMRVLTCGDLAQPQDGGRRREQVRGLVDCEPIKETVRTAPLSAGQ